MTPKLHAIAAMTPSRVIGQGNTIPWKLKEDQKFFKHLTIGHTVVMGRKTHESLPNKFLPGRRNIVLSRSLEPTQDIEIVDRIPLLWNLDLTGEVYVIGGAQVYRSLLPYCQSVIVSLLTDEHEGDTYMPPFEDKFPNKELIMTFPKFQIWKYTKDTMDIKHASDKYLAHEESD